MTTTIPSSIEAAARIAACTTLTDLCAALNRLESEIADARRAADDLTRDGDYAAEMSASDRDYARSLRLADLVDLTSLPTYGDDDAQQPEGVYSWDGTSVLHYVSGTTEDGWEVDDRAAYND